MASGAGSSLAITGNYLLSDYVTFSLIWWVSLEVASVDKVLDPVE